MMMMTIIRRLDTHSYIPIMLVTSKTFPAARTHCNHAVLFISRPLDFLFALRYKEGFPCNFCHTMEGYFGASSSSNSTRKRKLLEVSQTVLPNGHSLKIVDKEKAPGRLLTSSRFLHSSENPLMSKIKNFLPQLKGANEELEARVNQGEDPNKFNVEYISDDEKQHVEMNIQLVADEHPVQTILQQ